MIGIYTRLSVEDDISTSIRNQINEGKAFAGNRKYEIYNEGEGVSGRSDIKDRPELDRLMKDIATDKIKTVWFRNQNRLERNSETFIAFSSLAKRKKIEVYFNDKLMDWNDPTSYLQSSILTAINSYQAELQSYQTKKVLLNRVLKGKAHGKSTPLGYKTDKKGYLIVDEEEKPIVEKIYQMCLEGNGSTTIRHYLNNNNIPTRYSKREGSFKIKNKHTGKITHKKKSEVIWSDKQIQDILQNPMYKGKRRWNDKLIDCPSIFNEFYWEKVQEQYKKNAISNNTGKKVDHLYLLKGLLECSECGRNYYGRKRTNKKDNFYMCSSKRYKHEKCTNRSINIDVLESFMWETIFINDTIFNKVKQAFKDGGQDKRKVELENKIKGYQQTLKALDNEYKKTIDLVVRGVVSENDIKDTKNRVVRETNKINELLTNDENELFALKNETKLLDDIKFDWSFLDKEARESLFKEGKEELREQIKNEIIIKRRKRKFNPTWNGKKRILHKYISRILIQYDNDFKIYNLTIRYNLPIEDEMYLIDSNYISAMNYNTKKLLTWKGTHQQRFTWGKMIETDKKLKNYNNESVLK
ncbi:recombinase family protein [Maribacter litoralis]|uniref:recombinase family protein n=1 Tax=Maribacter litoralis TaxID=2059726 RepID=UPI003D29CB0F